uniref:RabBD domain-containing protein n=1 Tax=Schistosoma mansoni TaxID=6183 RepID=A0A3Q0KQC8_SCHMA
MANIDMTWPTTTVTVSNEKTVFGQRNGITEKSSSDNIQKSIYSSIQNDIENLNLNYLNEDERQKVLCVVKKDFEVRAKERERLNRFRSSILRRDRELAAKHLTSLTESTSCLLCGRPFILLINPKRICYNCKREICRNCSESINQYNEFFCRMCLKEKNYRAMTCNWFYETVIQRFREFGSTAVAKSLFGSRFKQVQDMAEEELWNLLFRTSSSKRNSIESKESETFYSADQAREAQIKKLRNRLEKLMEETLTELNAVEKNDSLSPRQITWQHESVSMKFKKNACREMRNFIQILYVTTEKERMSQGMNTKNITPYVMDTLEGEIGRIVGYSVKGITDTNSLAVEDDKESVTMVDRDGVEGRLAEVLYNKLYSDLNSMKQETVKKLSFQASSPVSTDTNLNKSSFNFITESDHNNNKHELSVIEGFPIRMEYSIPYNEQCEIQWYKLNNKNQRVPVKFDFRIEHVITGTINMSFKQHQQLNHQYPKHPFVLSNSGFITSETKQKLNQWNCKLLEYESNSNFNTTNNNNGNVVIYLQHHLIIWASKLDDAGRYFASNQYPSNTNDISSTKEKEFILQVIKSNQSPGSPQCSPEFIEPLIVQPMSSTNSDPFIEMTCIVTGNPIPRCLLYRNSVPIPVVVMPFLNIQSNDPLSTLSSLTQKYIVTTSLLDLNKSNRSNSCTRKITLRLNRPSSSEDIATYSCRAWNCYGRTITSTVLSVQDHFTKFDCPLEKPNLNDNNNIVKIDPIQSAVNTSQSAHNNDDTLVRKEESPLITILNESYDGISELKRFEPKYSSSIIEILPENQCIDVNMKNATAIKQTILKENDVIESPKRNIPGLIMKKSYDYDTTSNISSEVDIKNYNTVNISSSKQQTTKITKEVISLREEINVFEHISDDNTSQSNYNQSKRRISLQSTGPKIFIDRRHNRTNRRSSTSSNITEL